MLCTYLYVSKSSLTFFSVSQTEYQPCVKTCIDTMISGDKELFFKSLKQLTKGQMEFLRPMITDNTLDMFTANYDINFSVKISGSGDCSIPHTLAIPGDFTYKVSGSGDLSANVIVCKNLETGISGSGDISIKSVTAQSTKVSISGSGDADLGCNGAGDIDVRISGSGDVRLHGIARSLNTKISGSGDIDTRNLRLTGE